MSLVLWAPRAEAQSPGHGGMSRVMGDPVYKVGSCFLVFSVFQQHSSPAGLGSISSAQIHQDSLAWDTEAPLPPK